MSGRGYAKAGPARRRGTKFCGDSFDWRERSRLYREAAKATNPANVGMITRISASMTSGISPHLWSCSDDAGEPEATDRENSRYGKKACTTRIRGGQLTVYHSFLKLRLAPRNGQRLVPTKDATAKLRPPASFPVP